jgi:hypothetical protein
MTHFQRIISLDREGSGSDLIANETRQIGGIVCDFSLVNGMTTVTIQSIFLRAIQCEQNIPDRVEPRFQKAVDELLQYARAQEYMPMEKPVSNQEKYECLDYTKKDEENNEIVRMALRTLEFTKNKEMVEKTKRMTNYIREWKKSRVTIKEEKTQTEFWDKHMDIDKELDRTGEPSDVVYLDFHKWLCENINDQTKYLSDNPAYDFGGLNVGLNFHNLPSLEYANGKYCGFGIDIDGMQDAIAIFEKKNLKVQFEKTTFEESTFYKELITIVEKRYPDTKMQVHNALYDAAKNVFWYCSFLNSK